MCVFAFIFHCIARCNTVCKSQCVQLGYASLILQHCQCATLCVIASVCFACQCLIGSESLLVSHGLVLLQLLMFLWVPQVLLLLLLLFLWAGSWVHKGAILSGKPTYYLLLKHVLTFIIKQQQIFWQIFDFLLLNLTYVISTDARIDQG